jgi:putative ABC transport system permease protein
VEIVGIVGNVPNDGLQNQPLPEIYTPYTVLPWDSITLSVRTSAPISEALLRSAVASVNRTQAVYRVSSLDDRLREAGWGRQLFVASLFLSCAVCALLLAALGLYSVVAYAVSQRAKEFALRNALGATRPQILSLIFGSVGSAVAIGLGIGVVITAALDRPIAAWTETSLLQLSTIGPAVALIALVVACAVFVPARNALSTDSMVALRAE